MNQQEAQAERDRISEARKVLRAQEMRLNADHDLLRAQCPHTDASYVTHMGESCRHCYDCSSCDVPYNTVR